MGSRHAIAQQFATHVLRELQELGALSMEGEPPLRRGREMLEEDTLDAQEVVSGYVFQDPWTCKLWPRMVVREEPQAVEYPDNAKGYPRLLWGTKDNPSREYAHLVFPEAGLAPATPRPEHILQASVQQSRHARRNMLEPSTQEEASLGFILLCTADRQDLPHRVHAARLLPGHLSLSPRRERAEEPVERV